MEAPFAEPLPGGREVQVPTNAKPHSAVCKYFHSSKVRLQPLSATLALYFSNLVPTCVLQVYSPVF